MKTNTNISWEEVDDAVLVEFLRSDSPRAIEEIYDRYWKKMLAVAYGIVKDKDDAQEIVQNVFIRLWDKRQNLKISNLSGYLATAVRYGVYTQIQRNRRKEEVGKIYLDRKQEKDFEEEKIYANFLKQYINGVVDKLPDRCKLVFVYSREEGKTIPEIAEKLDIAEKTVESHLTKALKRIRLSLKEIGVTGTSVLFILKYLSSF